MPSRVRGFLKKVSNKHGVPGQSVSLPIRQQLFSSPDAQPAKPTECASASLQSHAEEVTVLNADQSSTVSQDTSGCSPPNLWEEALRELSPDDQSCIKNSLQSSLASDHRSSSSLIDELCLLTRAKQKLCEDLRWRFEVHGQHIILRDIANKILRWLNSFKAVGDVVVNFDPVHLALPWAAVRFLLISVTADHRQLGDLLLGTERIAFLVNRCKVYEALYPDHSTLEQSNLNLRVTLKRIYVAILAFLTGAIRLYAQSTASRVFDSVAHGNKVEAFLDDCSKLEQQVELDVSNCQRMDSRVTNTKLVAYHDQLLEILQDMRKPLVRIDGHIQKLWDRSDLSNNCRILKRISDVPYEELHKSARRKRTPGTGIWLLQHPRFLQWQDSSASMIIWVHGIPGAGKTKLATTVVDDMFQNLQRSDNDKGLAYFYCNRDQDNRNNSLSVVRSLVRQLSVSRADNAVQRLVVKLYKGKKQNGFASGLLDLEECQTLLLQHVNLFTQTTLILDALDECDPASRHELVETFDLLIDQTQRPVRIFISSRPNGDIKRRFEIGPNINIQATDNHDDIARFVAEQLEAYNKSRRQKLGVQVQDDIVATLMEKGNGMFQWAYLQIAQILKLSRESDIRAFLGKLPATLKQAYDEVFDVIKNGDGSDPQIAERAFRWILCSKVPLSPSQLVAAVCQDPEYKDVKDVDVEIDDVLRACSNLLVLDTALNQCRFSHLSVAEYIEDHQVAHIQAELYVANTCLHLLNKQMLSAYTTRFHDEKQDREWSKACEEQTPNDLARYIVFHWNKHVHRFQNHMLSKSQKSSVTVETTISATAQGTLMNNLKTFFGSEMEASRAYQDWLVLAYSLKLLDLDDLVCNTGVDATPLYGICYLDYHDLLILWYGQALYSNHELTEAVRSPLPFSVQSEQHFHTVQSLLESGIDVNVPGGPHGSTALQLAAGRGYDNICQLLINAKGADVNLKDHHSYHALYLAAKNGHEVVCHQLIGAGADVDSRAGSWPDSSIRVAAYNGYETICHLLIEAGADANAQGGYCNTALNAAIRAGHERIGCMLIDAGANINAQGGVYGTALQAAVQDRNEKFCRILLEAGAEVNCQGGEFGNALQAAAYNGLETIFYLLIDAGADINARGGICSTILQAAVFGGSENICQFLLEAGVDVNVGDKQWGSPLSMVRQWKRSPRITEMLLEYGACEEMTMPSDASHTP